MIGPQQRAAVQNIEKSDWNKKRKKRKKHYFVPFEAAAHKEKKKERKKKRKKKKEMIKQIFSYSFPYVMRWIFNADG